MSYPRNVIIKDLTAKWVKIMGEAPTNQFGGKQWEMQVQTTDAAKAKEFEDAGLKVKTAEEDGVKVFSVNLKRKATKNDGNPMTPVKVVDGALQAFPTDKRIGNGSKVNVNLWQYEYEFMGRKGVSTSLTAVQVIDLVEYIATNSAGFDAVNTAAPAQQELGNNSPF